jgi:hypothetical protein
MFRDFRHWLGEDTGFCRLWHEMGGKMWIYPDITFNHYGDDKYYRGNYREFLKYQIVPIKTIGEGILV